MDRMAATEMIIFTAKDFLLKVTLARRGAFGERCIDFSDNGDWASSDHSRHALPLHYVAASPQLGAQLIYFVSVSLALALSIGVAWLCRGLAGYLPRDRLASDCFGVHFDIPLKNHTIRWYYVSYLD